jgi:hypothetical protein
MDENMESYDLDPDGSSNLDHALLESLFYNEMAMMDDMSGLLSLMDTSATSSSAMASPALVGHGINYSGGDDVESMLLLDSSNPNSNYFPLHLPTETIGNDSSSINDLGVTYTETNPQSNHLSGVSVGSTWESVAPDLPSSFAFSSPQSHFAAVLPVQAGAISHSTQEPARLTPSQLIALTQNRPNRGIRHNVTSTSDTPSVVHGQNYGMTNGAMANTVAPNSITLQPHPATTAVQTINPSYEVIHPSMTNNNTSLPFATTHPASTLPAIPNPLGYLSVANTPISVESTPIQHQVIDPALVSVGAVAPAVEIATQNKSVPLAATPIQVTSSQSVPHVALQKSTALIGATSPNTESSTDEKKRTKLLSQFATLASRLGITLPPQVLKHLTDGKTTTINPDLLNARTALTNQVNVKPSGFANVSSAPIIQAEIVQSSNDGKNDDITPSLPKVQSSAILELQATAAEAIAAATSRKRFSPDNSSDEEDDNYNNNGKKRTGTSKMYSKRRKKPRLNECETKLAELRAENEMLKRHLDNISNKTAKLEQERVEVEKTMKRMFDVGAPDGEIDQLLKNYSDMYSDYGVKRDQELSFHLEQLRRYVHFSIHSLWV